MVANRKSPTDTEMEILRVLWDQGPTTVRDIHDAMGKRRNTGYTTFLKLLQLMHQKGLVWRDESSRSHVYGPAVNEAEVQDLFVQSLLTRAFDGSASKLVMNALSHRKASREELQEIRALIDKMEDNS